MGSDAQMNITGPQANEFRCAKSRLYCRRDQRVIASSNPRGSVRCREQSVNFCICQEAHEVTFESLGWNRKDSLDGFRMFRMTKSCVAKQRPNRRQPGVACADTIAVIVFTMIEKCADQRRIQITDSN